VAFAPDPAENVQLRRDRPRQYRDRFGVFTFAYKVLELPLVASNVLAWLVAVSGSYVMNTMIAFRAESGRMLRRKD